MNYSQIRVVGLDHSGKKGNLTLEFSALGKGASAHFCDALLEPNLRELSIMRANQGAHRNNRILA